MIRPRIHAALIALVAAFGVASPLAAAPAAAQDSTPVSWSVSPADAAGPDGRIAVDAALDAGATRQDHLAVRNLGAEEVTFKLAAADGFYNRKGRFDMLPSDQKSVAAGTWIALPESVTVAPGATVVVPFTITVPSGAEPGDYAAGVAASVLSVKQGEGAGVGVESRVGFRVMVRVSGDLAPAYAITNVRTGYRTSWNPARPGIVTADFDVVNKGNTRLQIAGVLDIAGRQVDFPSDDGRKQELLPGEARSFSVVVPDVWPLFAFSGAVQVTPSVSSAGAEPKHLDPASASVFVWAMPWAQLLVIGGILFLAVALLWQRARSKRRLDLLLIRAREEGRRETVAEAKA